MYIYAFQHRSSLVNQAQMPKKPVSGIKYLLPDVVYLHAVYICIYMHICTPAQVFPSQSSINALKMSTPYLLLLLYLCVMHTYCYIHHTYIHIGHPPSIEHRCLDTTWCTKYIGPPQSISAYRPMHTAIVYIYICIYIYIYRWVLLKLYSG